MTFHELYKTYYPRAFRFVKSYVNDKDVAEDIVAESMVALWSKFDPAKDATTVQFLFTILKNRALDYLRAQKNHMIGMDGLEQWEMDELELRISSLNSTSESSILSDEINRLAMKTLSEMPKRTQEIFRCSRVEGKSYIEISRLYDISQKGVEYHMSLALKMLRTALKDYMPTTLLFH